jgi:hypothetical protein
MRDFFTAQKVAAVSLAEFAATGTEQKVAFLRGKSERSLDDASRLLALYAKGLEDLHR